jgi:hypothetical protein
MLLARASYPYTWNQRRASHARALRGTAASIPNPAQLRSRVCATVFGPCVRAATPRAANLPHVPVRWVMQNGGCRQKAQGTVGTAATVRCFVRVHCVLRSIWTQNFGGSGSWVQLVRAVVRRNDTLYFSVSRGARLIVFSPGSVVPRSRRGLCFCSLVRPVVWIVVGFGSRPKFLRTHEHCRGFQLVSNVGIDESAMSTCSVPNPGLWALGPWTLSMPL